MYQALYRKYRPRDFDDVVGQEHITRTLKNEVAAGKFSHAYLFTGSRGTGKTTCSKIVAKAVNCLSPRVGNPCNECAICKGIDDGAVLDVVEIDAASNNGVDNIRELREEAGFTPAVAKYRVYILDECHMLSPGAVNALLKILEEPPAHVLFILATTEIHKVLPTILSRCQRFDFKRIKSRIIADRLLYVCEQEGFSLTDEAALLIGRLSDGGMRDALSLLDLCISRGEQVTAALVTEAAGISGQSSLFELADAVCTNDPAGALRVVAALSEDSVDFTRLCEQFAGHYRNLMLMKTVDDPDDLIAGPQEELGRLREQSGKFSLNRILYALDLLQDTMGRISRTAFKRTELEMALVRLCDPSLGRGVEGLAERLDKLERAVRTGAVDHQPAGHPAVTELPGATPAAPAADRLAASPPAKPKTIEAALSAGAGTQAEVASFAQWPQVLAELRKTNGALYGAMSDSDAYVRGEMMLIDCQNEMFRTLLRTSVAAKESLRDAILLITGQKYNLGPFQPDKHKVALKSDPLEGALKKASELGIPVEVKE